VIGGYLNDNHSPVAIWIGASAMAFVGTIGFLSIMVYRRNKKRHVAA
jgi:hypothetical protein